MNPVMALLGVLGLSALFRKRPIPSPTGRTRTSLTPPLVLLLGVAGVGAALARSGRLGGPR